MSEIFFIVIKIVMEMINIYGLNRFGLMVILKGVKRVLDFGKSRVAVWHWEVSTLCCICQRGGPSGNYGVFVSNTAYLAYSRV